MRSAFPDLPAANTKVQHAGHRKDHGQERAPNRGGRTSDMIAPDAERAAAGEGGGMIRNLFGTKAPKNEIRRPPRLRGPARKPTGRESDPFVPAPVEEFDSDPLKSRWQQERDSEILAQRERWSEHPEGEAICGRAIERLDRRMAFVPLGRATLLRTLTEEAGGEVTETEVEPFLLDVHCVTNDRYQKFVDAGGYEDLSLWAESVWPQLVQMRDQTDKPGPRFWRDGRHDQRLSNHPVVGISWYEAAAYAGWIGQRLPTEAEWQMAASWRIKSETDVLYRFPWGDAMDRRRCIIWAAGHGQTVPVDAYDKGAAPNGVLQLIGNVWEWLACDLDLVTEDDVKVIGDMTMKVTRGGAFDTYFESQATTLFRTGHTALTRTHNVGFRCALSIEDAPWLGDEA